LPEDKAENQAFIFIPFCGEQEAKADWSPGAVTKTFALYFHYFQQNHQNQNCFCRTPCNHRVVEEDKRLLAGPGKRCGPEQSG